MSSSLINISNPYSTGGGGIIFENHVQTAFVVLMLAGGYLPCLPGKKITKLKLQCKNAGFSTDDIVAYTVDNLTNAEHKLFAQIKHDISITNNDKQFQKVINSAWADFNNPLIFNKEKDVIALITGPLSKSDIYDTRIILDWARHSENEKEYFENKIKLANFCSNQKRNKVEVFRKALNKANKNIDISDELIFSFLRHFYIIGYDLDIKAGVTHSLLTTIINKFQPNEQAISIWSRICEEVYSYNQNAGTITIKTLPADVTDYFKTEIASTIPREYSKPSLKDETIIAELDRKLDKPLFTASVLGGWNENSQDDIEIIEELTGGFKNWINCIREIKNYNDEIISLKNGHWQVKDKISVLLKYASFFYDSHLDSFKSIAIKVLSEVHPKFDLNPEDRYAAALYGKTSKYSSELRKGISETIAFLGVYGSKLKNCSLHKPEDTVDLIIRDLFNDADWKLWASLNDLLPIIAEAAPNEFLSSVENALKQYPSPFDELFSQEGLGGVMGTNYMTGLYWALETLAWSEEYLARTILTLAEIATHDPGGKWANRPSNSITTILLPWMPHTTASFEKRIASLRGIRRNFPDIAWKIVISLLPNQHQISMGSHKPSFRNFIPEDWKQEVPASEYWKQVQGYAAIAIDMAKGNMQYVSALVENLDNIPQPSFSVFLDYLSSDEILNLPDEQKQPIWDKMVVFIRKHRRFSDAKWALPSEMVNLLEQTANKIYPSNPEYLHRHLFSNRDYEFLDKDIDWHTQQEIILKQRIEAIRQIYKINKTVSVISFAEHVENPVKVGNAFAHIADEENDRELLPDFLESQEQFKKQFISGYVSSRYQLLGINWIDNQHTETWSIEQKCALLFNVPFEIEIWQKADELLGEQVGKYWKNINANPFSTQSSLLPAIKNLLRYNRPLLALDCIYAHYFSKKELFIEQAIEALLKGTSTDEPIGAMDAHHVIEIIKMLQVDPQINEDKLFKIEWAYLPLLDSYNNAEPKLLYKKLSQDPDFFIEIIQLIYRSKNQTNEQEPDETRKNIASNAWKLLYEWNRPPGKLDVGTFSGEALIKWYNEVKEKTIESGHYEIAMEHLGQVLFYTDPDPDGLWIHKSVADLIDEKDNEYIRKGFVLKVYNVRGVYTVDPTGKPEREIAASWRHKAAEIEKLGLIRFASELKALANSYDREAERIISGFGNKDENENGEELKNDQ